MKRDDFESLFFILLRMLNCRRLPALLEETVTNETNFEAFLNLVDRNNQAMKDVDKEKILDQLREMRKKLFNEYPLTNRQEAGEIESLF